MSIIKINEDFTSYAKIKQLDLESEKKMTEGPGPADECICHILMPPDEKTGGIGGAMKNSIKKAIRSMSGSVRRKGGGGGGAGWGGGGGKTIRQGETGVVIPLTTEKGGYGIYTSKCTLKRKKPCGRCGCDNEKIKLKHSYANIKIITPDVSSICPCPNSCIDAEALNNIKVTVERLELHPDITDSEASVATPASSLPEPVIEKRSASELINAQNDVSKQDHDRNHDIVLVNTTGDNYEGDDISEWSFGIAIGEEEEEEEESELEGLDTEDTEETDNDVMEEKERQEEIVNPGDKSKSKPVRESKKKVA